MLTRTMTGTPSAVKAGSAARPIGALVCRFDGDRRASALATVAAVGSMTSVPPAASRIAVAPSTSASGGASLATRFAPRARARMEDSIYSDSRIATPVHLAGARDDRARIERG